MLTSGLAVLHPLPLQGESVFERDQRVAQRTTVMPPLPEDRFLCAFSHIFAGGYSAGWGRPPAGPPASVPALAAPQQSWPICLWHVPPVRDAADCWLPPHPQPCCPGHSLPPRCSYYSYKWAEVLSADAFAAFEDAGLEDEAAVAETGRRFRDTVLALGGGREPGAVFKVGPCLRGLMPAPAVGSEQSRRAGL